MLTITIPGRQWWDEDEEIFKNSKPTTIQLEHSLISLSKWEAKYKKPFLNERGIDMSREETLDYIRFMTITQSVKQEVYESIDQPIMDQIRAYIDDKMTATVINRPPGGGDGRPVRKETVTSELIYYWMVSANIPWEAQKWHLNRLLTLIEVIGVKNEQAQAKGPYKKPSRAGLRNRSALNAQRRAARHSRG